MNSSTNVRSTAPANRTTARAGNAARGSHLVDYVVHGFFIASLAAPFLIYLSPAPAQDADQAIATPAVVSSAPGASAQRPTGAATSNATHGADN